MYSNMRSPSVASRSRGGPVGSTDNFSLDCDAESKLNSFMVNTPSDSFLKSLSTIVVA